MRPATFFERPKPKAIARALPKAIPRAGISPVTAQSPRKARPALDFIADHPPDPLAHLADSDLPVEVQSDAAADATLKAKGE